MVAAPCGGRNTPRQLTVGWVAQLKTAAEHIEALAPDVIALPHSCELFIRYVTRSNHEIPVQPAATAR